MISIVGNNKLTLTVQNFIKEKRIPHAILIEGDYGTGKHTLAKFISKAIVCSGADCPCDGCNNCHLADIKSHPDITEIAPLDGKKSITVDQIRSLREETVIKPHQAEKRVFVIDGADTMNPQSQNALLKVLEEPPKTVMFILIAESKTVLLDTIISRCVTLSLTTPEFSVALDYIKSKTDFSEELIKEALELQKNNIGRALNTLNGVSSSSTEESAEKFLESAINGDRFNMLKITAAYSKNRILADSFIKDLKYLITRKIRNSPNSALAKTLYSVYGILAEFEESLTTNINLNLMFCNLTSKTTELIGRNK
ncbi:MAG: DNA polymerase III subunit delta' [Ruminococcaceae bacterium]|nr:DNA polymerase III subunit delta' [Oscillospiraceae bacterium]